MGLLDLFRRKPPPPKRVGAPAPLPFKIEEAPPAQIVPITRADPLDRAVLAHWQDFQEIHGTSSWQAFLQWLKSGNTDLDAEIFKAQRSIAEGPKGPGIKR